MTVTELHNIALEIVKNEEDEAFRRDNQSLGIDRRQAMLSNAVKVLMKLEFLGYRITKVETNGKSLAPKLL